MAALAFLDLSFKVTYLPYYSTTGIWKTCCSRDKTMLLKLHPMPGKLCQTDYFPKQMQQVAKYLQWSLTQFWWTIHLKTWGNSYAFPRIPYVKIKSSALKLQFSLSNPLWVPFLKIYIRSQVTNQKLHCQNWPYKKKTYAICPEADLPWTYPQPLAEGPKLELLIGCKRHARNLQRLKPKNTKSRNYNW